MKQNYTSMNRKRKEKYSIMKNIPRYKYIFAISDFLILAFSFVISAYLVRFERDLSFIDFLKVSQSILILFLVLTQIFIFIFQINGLYRINIILNRATHLTSIIKSLYYGALNIVVVSLLIKSTDILDSRFIIFAFIIIVLPLIYIIRVELLRITYEKFLSSQFKRNVIVVGGGKAGQILATKLMFEWPVGLDVIGFVDDNKKINEEIVNGKTVIGKIEDLPHIINEYKVHEILIAIDNTSYERLLEILDICKGLKTNVKLTSELFEVVPKKVATEVYADIPVVGISPKYNNLLTIGIKRIFDILISILLLILLSPLIILVTLLIKITSNGPIFFKQERIGKDGKPFEFFKFRSMYVTNEEDENRKKQMIEFIKSDDTNNSDTKIINQSRVTWIGKLIRKTSLDELPQLINVIQGDMSLVGPRPCLPYEYNALDKWQKRRVSVIPGCTGVWQVWGRSQVSFKDSIVLDLYYINNMSPWLDLELILKTIPVMLFSRGGR